MNVTDCPAWADHIATYNREMDAVDEMDAALDRALAEIRRLREANGKLRAALYKASPEALWAVER